eukprot:2020263-Rhodomonas_salina.2
MRFLVFAFGLWTFESASFASESIPTLLITSTPSVRPVPVPRARPPSRCAPHRVSAAVAMPWIQRSNRLEVVVSESSSCALSSSCLISGPGGGGLGGEPGPAASAAVQC